MREAFGDNYHHGSTLFTYQFTLLNCARYAESAEAGRRAIQLSPQAGDSHEWCVRYAQYFLGFALYEEGDLTAALAHGQAQYYQGRQRSDALMCSFGLTLWAAATDGLVPGEAIATELARSSPGATHNLELLKATLLYADGCRLLRAGEPGQAVEVLGQAIQCTNAAKLRTPMLLARLHALLVRALREQAAQVPPWACSVRTGLLRQARAIARRECRHPQPFRNNLASIFRELGLMDAMEGRNVRARRYFGRSLAIAERLDMRYERARTLLARAKVGTALGWPEAARDAAAGEEAMRPIRAALEPATVEEVPASLSLVDRFPRLLAAGRAIASALTREAVYSAVREAVSGLLRDEAPVLVEVTPEGASAPVTFDDRLGPFMHRALEQRRPCVPSTEELERAGCVEERSVLCAPILVRGEVAAVFRVTNHKLAGAFGPEEVRLAEYIATLAGAALENARGFAEVTALSEERERLYQQAQAALRKRDEFLVVASHELRTPFTPMRLYMQGLLGALKNPARAAGLESWVTKLETANGRLQRLAKLVEDMFDVSRIGEGRMPVRLAPVDLAALTVEAVERWKEELARVKCEYTLDAPEPVVGHWDGVRLEQVLDNLLGNAMKYGPGKPIHVSIRKHGEHARLVVRDEGMGIAPEDQARIFEKFERAVSENYGGFGLGLWISREVVRALGGRILVDSTPGQGATFTVELPLASPAGP